jgi:3-deoxy-7-phosphoheptulonate synthase
MEEDRLKLLAAAKKVLGLPIVTEVMILFEIDLIAKYVDAIQFGNQNICNSTLLKKRGMINTIQEFFMSSKYILCECGTRTFETATRNILDISCIPAFK